MVTVLCVGRRPTPSCSWSIETTKSLISQNVVAIKRGALYYGGKKHAWTEDFELAWGWLVKQARTVARIDIGMPCELVPLTFVRDTTREIEKTE